MVTSAMGFVLFAIREVRGIGVSIEVRGNDALDAADVEGLGIRRSGEEIGGKENT